MQGYVRPGNSQPVWLFPFIVSVVLFLSVLPLARLAVVGISAFANGGVMVVLSDPMVWSAVYYTIVTAILGTIISLAIGCAFAYLLTLTDIPAKGPLSFFFVLPMMIPPQVTALAWVQMSGPSSPLLKALHIAPPLGSPQPLYSVGGIALLYGVQHAPLVYLALRAGLMTLPRDGVEAARLSGASSLRVFRDIILPLSLPGVIAGAAISFVSCTGNFGIPAILGIPASIFTLPTLIFSKFTAFTGRTFGDVALLSAIIALISVAGLAIQDRALRGRDYRVIGLSGATAAFELGGWKLVFSPLLWIILFFMLAAPFFALVAGALVPAYGVPLTFKTMTFHAFEEILFRQAVTRTAFINSLSLASGAAVGLLFVTVLAAYALTRRKDTLSRIVSSLGGNTLFAAGHRHGGVLHPRFCRADPGVERDALRHGLDHPHRLFLLLLRRQPEACGQRLPSARSGAGRGGKAVRCRFLPAAERYHRAADCAGGGCFRHPCLSHRLQRADDFGAALVGGYADAGCRHL